MDSNKDILRALNAIQATLADQNRILIRNAAKQRKVQLFQLYHSMLSTDFCNIEMSDAVTSMIDEAKKEEQQYS